MSDFDGVINPAASWPDVPQLSTDAVAIGGPGGVMNAQAVALVARTKQLDATKATVADLNTVDDKADSALAAANAAGVAAASAQGDATTAQTAASNAQSAADNAGNVADAAQLAAAAAQAKADAALPKDGSQPMTGPITLSGDPTAALHASPKQYVDATALANSGTAVRQTVLNGPVDSNGFSAFGGSTGSTTVTASGTLAVTAANGATNRRGSITNPSWTGLSTNGTMYLGLTVNADGTCTPFSTTQAPTYQWGGTFSTTNGKRTFNIQQMQMQVGNGSAAAQAYDVFVGEVTVSGGVVTAITWYALLGRYTSALQNVPASGVPLSVSHNIGVTPSKQRVVLQNQTADCGYAVGDELEASNFTSAATPYNRVSADFSSRMSSGMVISPSTFGVYNKANGSINTVTQANWKVKFYCDRGW